MMHYFFQKLALTTTLTQTSAKTVKVTVGETGLQYVPDTILAKTGDAVQFSIFNVNSVVQSSFSSPCEPLSGGFNSGIFASCLECEIPAPHHFVLTINDTDPKWFYSSVG